MNYYKLHHIGCVVENLDFSKEYYINVLNYQYRYSVFDEQQNIKSYFLEGNGHYLELIQKINKKDKSPIDKIIQFLGGGVYHHCYEVENLDEEIKFLKKYNFVRYTKKIYENNYFRYIFMITPDNYLVEFLERKNLNGINI